MSETLYRMMFQGVKPTLQSSGTKTADGTEQTLVDVAVAGLFVLEVDLSVMQAGDFTVLRIYGITLTGGTRREGWSMTYQGAQPTDSQLAISLHIGNELTDSGSLRFTMEQRFGTGRAYPWKVMKLSA